MSSLGVRQSGVRIEPVRFLATAPQPPPHASCSAHVVHCGMVVTSRDDHSAAASLSGVSTGQKRPSSSPSLPTVAVHE